MCMYIFVCWLSWAQSQIFLALHYSFIETTFFIECGCFIYLSFSPSHVGLPTVPAFQNRKHFPECLFAHVCVFLRTCVCVRVVYVYLSPLIAPLSLTGPGKRVCVVSAAPVDWPYFWLQATRARGSASPQRLSPPDLRGLRQPRQPRQWSPAAWGGSFWQPRHDNSIVTWAAFVFLVLLLEFVVYTIWVM